MSLFLSKAQKRCGKRGHGFIADYESGEILSGCAYCAAYSGRPLGIAAMARTMHPIDIATRIAVIGCLLALAWVAGTCAAWLGTAL